jgi:D-alanyl-D-alanine carboxypeptidase/D-alanyl-D-alanine-endopeptidase (penicillin-binding protein 4)
MPSSWSLSSSWRYPVVEVGEVIVPIRRWTAGTAVLILGSAALALGPLGAADQRAVAQDFDAEPPPAQATAPLPPFDGQDAPALDPARLGAVLAPLLADPVLGPSPGMVVLDAATGEQVAVQRADVAVTPASSWKITTGLSALAALGPQHRLTTSVVATGDEIVLVGGGDPTLLTVPDETPPAYGAPATLADLADQTAAALAASGVTSAQVRYDGGLFTGPALSPDWDPAFVGLGIIAPVSALTLDAASKQVDPKQLDTDPAATAAAWFTARLTELGVAATLAGPGGSGVGGAEIASVRSAPLVALVDRMLNVSDNDVAEALFRLAAIGRGLPGSFEGGAQATTQTLSELGVPAPGLVVRDGSGLSRGNRVAPITLAAALQVASDPQSPALAGPTGAAEGSLGAITWAPPGLPVGGLTGSLADRFDSPATSPGAGRVHAKTGTLTGITSLTGTVATQQGRPVVFAVLGEGTEDTLGARRALDLIAAAIASCGCQAEPS